MRADSAPWTRHDVLAGSAALEIETPSWGYGNSGTRFHVFPWPGRRADRPGAHRRRRARPPADRLLPVGRAAHPVGRGRRLGDAARATPRRRASASARSTRTSSRTDEYRLGSLCHPDAGVRAQALEHCRECVEIAEQVGSTRHQPLARRRHELPGPGRPARPRTRGCSTALEELYARAARRACGCSSSTSSSSRPSTAPTSPDWGTAALVCRRLGPQAQVLVDTGHHPQGTNIEQIVALLLGRGAARRLPLQQPQVRRRRPDRRLDRPVRAVPDHARDRRDGDGAAERRLHDRPVAQRRGQDRRDDPVGR